MQKLFFSTIEEVFKHLEEEGYKYKFPSDIGNLFIPFKDKNNLECISEFETIIFNHLYITDENTIIESCICIDSNKNKYTNIEINNLSNNFYVYLKQREDESNHPFLKSYYSHLLWKLPTNTIEKKEKIKYAKTAINSYLELIKIYQTDLNVENVDNKICDAIKNTCMITIEINHSDKETIIKNILSSVNFIYRQNNICLAGIINYFVENYKNFKNQLSDINLQEICFNSANRLLEEKSFKEVAFKTIIFFRIGEKIDQKLNTFKYNWQLEIAKVYEKMSIERQDLANCIFCLKALNIYLSLKIENKIQETSQRYKQLISSRALFQSHQIIDVSSHINTFKTMIEELSEKNINEVLQELSSENSILVISSEIKVEDDNDFLNQLPISVLDDNGHISQQFEGEELKKYKKLRFYDILLDIYYNSFAHNLFYELVKTKKLTFITLVDFLDQNTWLGQGITKMVNGFTYQYRWLDFLKPSLQNYFEEINKMLENTEYQLNTILFIDSLTSKIEGIIRDILELNGEITFEPKKKDKDLTVTILLHNLFEHQSIKMFIKEDDLFFLKFLMVEKAGYNIRNKVSHCLMRYEDYNIKIADLLLIALLRLSYYKPTNHNATA